MKLMGYSEFWPTSYEECFQNWHSYWFVIDFCLSCLLAIVVTIFVLRVIKSKKTAFIYIAGVWLIELCVAFSLPLMALSITVTLLTASLIIFIMFQSELKSIFRDELGWVSIFRTKRNKNIGVNSKDLAVVVESAVIEMARNKCGALIVFERNDRITTDRFSRWSDLEAEVTESLLRTIFYKGTPLHDGATVVREGKIIRAGVIFDSVSVSTAAMPGSLGSRHRAALGVTESCDCFSVTVSEETGSIHICEKGRITKCYVSNFKEKFLECIDPNEYR
ncbi:MAG: DNA integrity scanning protein DisA nucleotide-binding domain protein [Bacilli bacterium]|nr:DNA integrity scanning protein DisA nucleotide-binding domain protein [Bacilli bacterium]